jgi:cell division protein FtsQ
MARNDGRFTPEDDPRAASKRHGPAASLAEIDDFADENSADPAQDGNEPFLRTAKRVPVRKGAVTKKTAVRLRWAVIALTIFAICGSAAAYTYRYGTHSWRFRIESGDDIQISGNAHVTRGQLFEVLGSDIGRNIFWVPLDDRRRQLEEIPWVESASVMRLWPNQLRVQITERTPVAYVRIGAKIALLDANGVIMDVPPRTKLSYSFPLITGMSDNEPLSTRAARMQIYSRLVRELDTNGANYSHDLSEVDLSDPEDVKITVEDAGGALVVHLGNSDFLNRYRIYIRHVNDWRVQFQKLESVDLRFNGQIIVNPDTRDERVTATPSMY